MEKLSRKTAPQFKTVDHIEILSSTKHSLSNHIPVHIINGGSQEVVKIEFIFKAGIWQQEKHLIATLTNTMLNEGTTSFSASEIAEKFDFLGAHIGFSTSKHDASIVLYSLKKHFPETLSLTADLIRNSIFPEKEFKTILTNKKQQFQIEHQKTNILAREKFNELIYGAKHPYSNTYDISEFDTCSLQDVKEFYAHNYVPSNCHIIIAGKVDETVLTQVESLFGEQNWSQKGKAKTFQHEISSSNEKLAFVCKEDAIQSTIRIGRKLFTKTHPDHTGMQLLNLVLGGYFGSRLMQNIREDKGYTYGINSIMISYLKEGHFTIATEVGSEVCKDAVREIFFEIKKLRENLVPEEELTLVKNYISGEMLRNLDSPFALSDSLKTNLPFGLNNSYYIQFIKDLKAITAEKIMELANTYLQEKDLYLIVSGPKESENALRYSY
ncbi:M16 family metallopeptidase [Labilibaculum sp.]|uniref:M16 family metallopeptidase n=1 Tax=Labilibaculum sp. TaxID=2060723 RepID=UPI00356401D0